MGQIIWTGEFPIDQIDASARMRPVKADGVEQLKDSIQRLGTMMADVHVRRIAAKDGPDRHVLLSGGHRLQAAIELGLETVPTKIWQCTNEFAKLVELDENLAHADLSPLDFAKFYSERKKVYLAVYPTTRVGVFKGNQHTTNLLTENVSFTKTIAEARGVSVRQVEMLIQIGDSLTAEQFSVLQAREATPTQRELLDLARLEPHARDTAIQLIASGDEPSLKHAVAAVHPKRKPIQKNDTDSQVSALMLAFSRANRGAQQEFVRRQRSALEEYLKRMTDDEGEQR